MDKNAKIRNVFLILKIFLTIAIPSAFTALITWRMTGERADNTVFIVMSISFIAAIVVAIAHFRDTQRIAIAESAAKTGHRVQDSPYSAFKYPEPRTIALFSFLSLLILNVFGIVSGLIALNAKKAEEQGDINKCRKQSRLAGTILIVSVVLVFAAVFFIE